jgi:hypothetical protein
MDTKSKNELIWDPKQSSEHENKIQKVKTRIKMGMND